MSPDNYDCGSISDVLAEYGDVELLPVAARRHVKECLRCQAELSGFRRLSRSLRELAGVPVALDPAIRHEILSDLDRFDDHANRRLAKATAATLGGLAAVAGVIVVASRQARATRLAG